MSNAVAPGAVEHHSVPVRSAKEIVDQTEELALELSRTFYGRDVASEGFKFHLSVDPRAQVCWRAACEAQKRLTNTDPEDALSELDEDGCEPSVERALAGDEEPVGFLVVQQGGSSDELYVNAYDTEADALDFRQSAAENSYPTSEPIAVPLVILDHPEFIEVALQIALAADAVDYPDDDEDTDEDEDTDSPARPRP